MGNTAQKQQQQKQEEELEVPNFNCEICMEPMSSKLRFKNSNKCCHPFCMDCIAKYIHATLEDNLAKIQCPALNCEELLEPLSCKPIISTELFDKWGDILRDSAVQGIQKIYCPYRDCSILVLNECGDFVKRSQCPSCKRLFCFECKMPWHAGYRCGEMKEMTDRNDILFGELVETKRWTRCFHCGHAVEVVEGCRHVKCRCGNKFCHRCGGKSHLLCVKNIESVTRRRGRLWALFFWFLINGIIITISITNLNIKFLMFLYVLVLLKITFFVLGPFLSL